MKEIFDTYVENSFGEYKQALFKLKRFEVNYKSFFPFNKDAAVIDIGIGRGEMLTCMNNWGYKNYLGIDISTSTVAFCKSIGLNCIQVKDSVEWLNEHKDTISLITLIDVLEHIKKENTLGFLKAIKNALRNDGTLIIQVPNLQSPDGHLHMYNDITHEVGYSEHSLQQVLITVGFKKILFYGFEDFVFKGIRQILKKMVRSIFWKYIKLARTTNCNLNPKILNPVFYAVVKKDNE